MASKRKTPRRAATGIRHQKIEVATPTEPPRQRNRGPEVAPHLIWPDCLERIPEAQRPPRPTKWVRGAGAIRCYPCPYCDRVLTDHNQQAVVCRGISSGTAYLICRCCRQTFSMEVV